MYVSTIGDIISTRVVKQWDRKWSITYHFYFLVYKEYKKKTYVNVQRKVDSLVMYSLICCWCMYISIVSKSIVCQFMTQILSGVEEKVKRYFIFSSSNWNDR